MTATSPQRFDDLPPATRAGILCNSPEFRRFAAMQCGLSHQQFTPAAAAEFLRQKCEITSRRVLNYSPRAEARFDALRTDFDAWRGRTPSPR